MGNQTILLQEDYFGTFRPKVISTVVDFTEQTFEIARIKNGVRETVSSGLLSEIVDLEDGILNFRGGQAVNLRKLGLNQDAIEKLRGFFESDYLAEYVHLQYSENNSLIPDVGTSMQSFAQSIETMLRNEREVKITLFKSGLRITYPEGTDLAVTSKPKVVDGLCEHFFKLDPSIGFEIVHVTGELTSSTKTKVKKEARAGAFAIFPVLPLVSLIVPSKKTTVTTVTTYDEREFELRMSGHGWQFLLPLGKGEPHGENFRAQLAKAVINLAQKD